MPPEQNSEHADTNRKGRKKLVISPDRREAIELLLSQLTPRETMILRWRYGLEDGYHHTLYEVAHEIGIAQERVRQLEARALNRLGEDSPFLSLLEYLDDDNPT